MRMATIEAARSAWQRLLSVDSRDEDVVRRAQSFIALCVTFAGVTAALVVPIALVDPAGDLRMSLAVLALVIANYSAGVLMARRGRVDLAGLVVGALLSTIVALAILLHFRALNDGIWFMNLSVIIAGMAIRPRLIWAVVGLNLALSTSFLVALPADPARPYHDLVRVLVLDALLMTTAVATYISATRGRDLFRRQREAVRELEATGRRAELSREHAEAAYELAEAANRAKSAFLANMSHELRTPLNAIIGYAELLQEDAGEGPGRADLGRIHAAGQHLLALISDILDLTKIEAGRMSVCAEHFTVAALVEQLTHAVRPVLVHNRNTLEVRGAADCGEAYTDRGRLRQILLNLVANAAKFTRDGQVRLECRRVGALLEFTVADTGIGMDAATLARVFEAFVQADDSATRRYGGTGLGLSLSRQLAELLGGTISASSSPGAGSTFVLRVPARLAAAERAA